MQLPTKAAAAVLLASLKPSPPRRIYIYIYISSATAAGAAGLAGEMEKDAKYDVLVSASDALFYPLAVESFGAWTPASLDSLRTIATKTITSNNIPFSQAYSNLMQQLSVNLWKFNARMIESRLLLDSDVCFWD